MTALKCGGFKVGEYAAIYDNNGACWQTVPEQKINYGEMSRTVGEIIDVRGDLIMIRTSSGECKVGSRKCARRVTKKPKSESKAPREWTAKLVHSSMWQLHGSPIDTYEREIVLTELKPGQLIIDPSTLAKAWNASILGMANISNADKSLNFELLCKALNLPSPEGKGGKG